MENNVAPENQLPAQKEITPVDTAWLAQWLKVLQHNQNTQIQLLQSIRGMLQFFVVLTVISMILGGCSILLSF